MFYDRKITKEDYAAMRELAEKLSKERNAGTRMMMQQKFVHDMEQTYGHEKATRMLTTVWRYPKRNKESWENLD